MNNNANNKSLLLFSRSPTQKRTITYRVHVRMHSPRKTKTMLSTGFPEIDKELGGGLRGGDLLLVAGRVTTGKTPFLHSILTNVASKTHEPILLWSGKLSYFEAAESLFKSLSVEVSCTHKILLHEKLKIVSCETVPPARSTIVIDDTFPTSVSSIGEKAAKVLHHGTGIIAIDYLQLLTTTNDVTTNTEEISRIMLHLKELADELDIPIIVVSQLERPPHEYPEKLLNIRADIENYADVVIELKRNPI